MRFISSYMTVLIVGLGALSGCSSIPPAPNVEPPSEYTYLLGPGDNIQIFVWGNPEVTRAVPVRPDGKITAPLIEELQAAGKTPFQLARDIEAQLSKYIRSPLVTVIVDEFVGPYTEQIRVIGQVRGGGIVGRGMGSSGGLQQTSGMVNSQVAVPYTDKMSLLDVMIVVGGVTEFAAGNRSILVRNVDGIKREFRLRIEDLIDRGDMTANVNLLPGDIIIVPEAYF